MVCVCDAINVYCVDCENRYAVVLVGRVGSGEEEVIPVGWEVLLVEDCSCCLCERCAVVEVS